MSAFDNPASSVICGRKVVASAGTAEALGTSSVSAISITAETDNTGMIVVGDSGVVASLSTRKGLPLNPGDEVTIQINSLSKLYIDSTVSGDGVTYLGLVQ